MTRVEELAGLGQAVWFDFIARSFLSAGELDRLVERGVRGVTSNPAIFEKAIAKSSDYDSDIRALAVEGRATEEIYEALAVSDILRACDVLLPVFEKTGGVDGYVSLEVSPRLAFDVEVTVSEAKRLFHLLGRPNVMIKVPSTPEGIVAIERLVAEGLNINATLIFSVGAYEAVARAYVKGLSEFAARGGDPASVASVASVFVSRIDTMVDPLLAAKGERELMGKAAVDNARLVYARFSEIFSGGEWERLALKGARVQRPLWASTGTKNPEYSDTLYVDTLIGPDTVNTMPPATLDAYFDHGGLEVTVGRDLAGARARLERLKAVGIDLDLVTGKLLAEGVASFAAAFDSLLASVAKKRAAFSGSPLQEEYGCYAQLVADEVARAGAEGVVERIKARDHTLWSPSPAEITNRMGWTDVAGRMAAEVPAMEGLRREMLAEGITKALLIGMGGSSLAPEVFARTFGHGGGLDLAIADTTCPDAIAALALAHPPAKSAFVVSTKSGGTVETLSLFKYFYHLAADALGPAEAGRRFVIITDPGSALERIGEEIGARAVFLNDPDIGGRYAALSLVGLVPASLLGADVARLIASSTVAGGRDALAEGARVGAAFGALARAGVDKLTLLTSEKVASFADWIEQLVAESTGKEGRGIVPVVGERPVAPNLYGADRLFVALVMEGDSSLDEGLAAIEGSGAPIVRITLKDDFELAAQFLFWEGAAAAACWSLGVNPFNQPDVESAKAEARSMLENFKRTGRMDHAEPACAEEGVEVYATAPCASSSEAFEKLLAGAGEGDYLVLQAYLPHTAETDRALRELRERLRKRTKAAVTIGYGPRFLHSTGQLHKGDSGRGRFVQFTAEDGADLPIPDDFSSSASSATFGAVKLSQALGDAGALAKAGRPVVRYHLRGEPARFIGSLA